MATSIQHCTGSFSQSNWVKKVGNKVVKVYFLDDMILYIENSIEQKSIITNKKKTQQSYKIQDQQENNQLPLSESDEQSEDVS